MTNEAIVPIIALCVSALSLLISVITYFRYYPRVKIDKPIELAFYQHSQHYEIIFNVISKSSYQNTLLTVKFLFYTWKEPSRLWVEDGTSILPFTPKRIEINLPQKRVYRSKLLLLKIRTCGRNTYKLINLKKSLLIDKSQQ